MSAQPVSPSTTTTCVFCGAVFRRIEHLRRHYAAHAGGKPHECCFCNASFNRRDVLRKHYKTCRIRLTIGADVPDKSVRGKPRQACDHCATGKRACDSMEPCTTCRAKGLVCSYDRIPLATDDRYPSSETLTTPTDSGLEEEVQEVQAAPRKRRSDEFSPTDFEDDHAEDGESYDTEMQEQYPGIHPYSLDPPVLTPTFELPKVSQAMGGFDFLLNFARAKNLKDTFEYMMPCEPPKSKPKSKSQSQSQSQPQSQPQSQSQSQSHSPFSRETSFSFSSPSDQGSVRFPSISSDSTRYASSESSASPGFQDQAALAVAATTSNPDLHFMPLNDGLFEYHMDSAGNYVDYSTFPTQYTVSPNLKLSAHPLAKKSRDIFDKILLAAALKDSKRGCRSISEAAPSPKLLNAQIGASCIDFFSPPNIERLLDLYWARWNRNCPIFHTPTFDPKEVSPTLICVMMLIGAMFSTADDALKARSWLDLVEDMVFDDPLLDDDLEHGVTGLPLDEIRQRLRALQATYLICILQYWEGSLTAKRRCRRRRYSAVIAIAREMGLPHAVHGYNLCRDLHHFSWMEFIVYEEMIRTFSWIFSFDCLSVVFNNRPPRMVVQEMVIDMACPEPCFEATNKEDCYNLIPNFMRMARGTKIYVLSELIQKLCYAEFDDRLKAMFVNMSVQNLFLVVTAIHALIFYLQGSLTVQGPGCHIREALTRWKTAWDEKFSIPSRSEDTTQDAGENDINILSENIAWRKAGFYRFAHEYWLLAVLSLEAVATPSKSCKDDVKVEVEDFEDLKFRPFELYDETDMKQVGDLMTDFQTLGLSVQQDYLSRG